MAVAVVDGAKPSDLGGFIAMVCEAHARTAHEIPLCASFVERLS